MAVARICLYFFPFNVSCILYSLPTPLNAKQPQNIIFCACLNVGCKFSGLNLSPLRLQTLFLPSTWICKKDSSENKTVFQSSISQSLCFKAHCNLLFLCSSLMNGFRAATYPLNPASIILLRIVSLETFFFCDCNVDLILGAEINGFLITYLTINISTFFEVL